MTVRGRTILTLWAALLCLGLAQGSVMGGERPPNGREIYRNRCAKCHGKNGEGVPGKYDDALRGDRTLPKLTRLIERTMPEDDPKTCLGPEAEAVSKYIYDAFYSAEAHSKAPPPRVELAHLTTRQHLNAVADLLRGFEGKDEPLGEARGLRATYYSSRDFNGDKKLYERTDQGIDFDFGDGGPQGVVTNEFSIQWRGALIAPETGHYDLIVRSPNGLRFWFNDPQEPVVDAWVSSGVVTEHQVSMRLIGGRAYPVRLDCFRFKDKQSSIALLWKPPHAPRQVIPGRNLAPAKASPTFVLKTVFPADDSILGYERGVGVSKEWDEAVTQSALEVAGHVARNLDRYSGSKAGDTNRTAKVEAFCAKFVTRAFHRPLTPEQQQVYVTGPLRSSAKLEDAVRRVVILSLKSPQFLYLGLNGGKADDFDVATRLSFTLWDSIPDSELSEAAARRELRTPAQISAQATRMLADPRARTKLGGFLHQWLQLDRGEEVAKDPAVFPGFTPELVADLRTSLDIFLEEVVWSPESDYRKLLLADYVYLNEPLAKYYGLAAGASNRFARVSFDPEHRAGVLTHPYLLSAFSYQKSSSPIHRGVFLSRKIIGRALKPPPMAVAFKDADFAPNLTMREKVTELTRPQSCQSCHSVINPLGFSLENFDAVGRYRGKADGREIDTKAEYVTEDGDVVRLAGARDIAQFAAASPQAHRAFVAQMFQQLVKQPAAAYGRDTMDQLCQSFAASGFNIRKLALDIAALTAAHGLEPAKPAPKKS